MPTTTTKYTDDDWQEATDVDGESLISATCNIRYAFGENAPAAGVIGYLLLEEVPVTVNLPASRSCWVRPAEPLGTGGEYSVNVTPAAM